MLGIHYIHQKKNLIQRDLKSRNVLIDSELNAKVADFGLSRLKDEDAGMTACGTPAWTAPEIIRNETYDEKVDVYSFGIVLWEMIALREPFEGVGGIEIVYAAAEGRRPPIPQVCPVLYKDLMTQCWCAVPQERPHFGQIIDQLLDMMNQISMTIVIEFEENLEEQCQFE